MLPVKTVSSHGYERSAGMVLPRREVGQEHCPVHAAVLEFAEVNALVL